jgi:UDP-N-acetylmuramoyl-tripeptide--D-alanyl-D-alanine ligase
VADALWTSAEIARATGGRLHGQAFDASGVSFDSREIGPGDLFVALAGVRDGHEFATAAFERGAAGAIASREVAGPHVHVPDTLIALEGLAAAARDRSAALRGAVTGSVGKTSVTQAVKAGLALAGPAHGSVKSYNNHIGVPLTLARMPRETERAIFEIGMNHAGEIEPLSRLVQPHAAVVTNVGPVHTENFADGEAGVARAKSEIFAGLKRGGVAILNADSRWFDLLKAAAEARGAKVRAFGSADAADAKLTGFEARGQGARVRARLHGRDIAFPIAQSGLHWGPNSLAVLLMLEALDVGLDIGLQALADFAPLAGRGAERVVRGPRGAFTLIDESYNANPISMRAAIGTLGARRTEGRRLVALTDMLELGPDAARLHAAVGQSLDEAAVDLVFLAGPLMKDLWDAIPAGRRGGYAASAAELAPQVLDAVQAGDVVMVKGSNGSRAGVIAAALAGLDRATADAGGAA